MKKRILITGSGGRFAKILKRKFSGKNIFYMNKKQLNVLNYKAIIKNIKKYKIDILIHLAGLSRPMIRHEKNISDSINGNIIGTANVVKACAKENVKIIYFSTSYVYPGTKGNYKETDSLLPVNNYAWSKLGGEACVHLYNNSLILRICMTEKPFVHKTAFSNIKLSFMYQDEVATILPKLLDKKGIINIGGKKQSPYEFAKKSNKNIKKTFFSYTKYKIDMPKDSSINTNKLKKIFK